MRVSEWPLGRLIEVFNLGIVESLIKPSDRRGEQYKHLGRRDSHETLLNGTVSYKAFVKRQTLIIDNDLGGHKFLATGII